MSIASSDVQNRIIAAAEKLHAENPDHLPTVAEVRAESKADMNSVSSVMKAWRQNKLMPVQRIEESAPAEIQQSAKELSTQIWNVAKAQAESKLKEAEQRYSEEREESEKLRAELSEACDQLQKQLDDAVAKNEELIQLMNELQDKETKLSQQLNESELQTAKAKDAEKVALSKIEEQAEHINTLKNALIDAEKNNTLKDIEHRKTIENLESKIDAIKDELSNKDNEINKIKEIKYERENQITELKGQLLVAQATAEQAKVHAKDLKDILDKQTALVKKEVPVKKTTSGTKTENKEDNKK